MKEKKRQCSLVTAFSIMNLLISRCILSCSWLNRFWRVHDAIWSPGCDQQIRAIIHQPRIVLLLVPKGTYSYNEHPDTVEKLNMQFDVSRL
jgi:hypothetical protein